MALWKKNYNTNRVITDLQVYNAQKNKSYKKVWIKLYGTRKRNAGMHIILLQSHGLRFTITSMLIVQPINIIFWSKAVAVGKMFITKTGFYGLSPHNASLL